MLRHLRQKGAKRLVFACFGVALVLTGVSALSAGRPAYRNYKGQWVFPPVAIALGLGTLVHAFRTPRRQSKNKKRPGTR
jgi:energy-converting hydrogenase Eha subunit A